MPPVKNQWKNQRDVAKCVFIWYFLVIVTHVEKSEPIHTAGSILSCVKRDVNLEWKEK